MSFFSNENPTPTPEGAELVATVYDPIKVAIIRSIFDAEEIPYLVKERGAGASLSIIMGANFLGTDIFVAAACYDKAIELLEPLFSGEDADCDEDEDDFEDEDGFEDEEEIED